MRFNEKELVSLSRQPSEKAAELGMRGPKKGDVVKKRLVKLVVNFLFYFRTDEEEPIGALLLEQCRVEREDSHTFSIVTSSWGRTWYSIELKSTGSLARTRWSSMVYQMKPASRSAMACNLCLEIPPPCRPASCVQMCFILPFQNSLISTHAFLDLHSECVA